MHAIFGSSAYKEQIKSAFQSTELKSDENTICTKIYFDMLELIASEEASQMRKDKLTKYFDENCTKLQLDHLDKSSLRYIAGACIHSVKNDLAKLSMNQVMNKKYEAQVTHRKNQLTSRLVGPPSRIESEMVEPESLIKLLMKDTGGLLYVTDQCFNFFKMLLLKIKQSQNIVSIQYDPENVFLQTVEALRNDTELLSNWYELFDTNSGNEQSSCSCSGEDLQQIDPPFEEILPMELDQLLIYDILVKVILYFCKVHLNEKVTQLKDYILEKPKTYQHRHVVDLPSSKVPDKTQVDFPCGFCGRECIEIVLDSQKVFENFSVQCNKCTKWYHYQCMNLIGKEPELQENSTLPFFCTNCVDTQGSNDNNVQKENNSEMDVSDSTVQASDHKYQGVKNFTLVARPTREDPQHMNAPSTHE